MATAAVTGEQYYELDGKLSEIKRQLRQKGGYPHDINKLDKHLHAATEGRFVNIPGRFLAEFRCSQLPDGPVICDIVRAFNPEGHLSDATRGLLLQMDVLSEVKDVYLWSVTGKELGFTTAVAMHRVYERAEQFGLGLVTPQMMVEYFIKIKPDNILIKNHFGAMKPVIVKANYYDPFCIFCILNGAGTMVLSYQEAHSNTSFNPEVRWIFTCPPGWVNKF